MKKYPHTWNTRVIGRVIQDDSKHIDRLAQFTAHATFWFTFWACDSIQHGWWERGYTFICPIKYSLDLIMCSFNVQDFWSGWKKGIMWVQISIQSNLKCIKIEVYFTNFSFICDWYLSQYINFKIWYIPIIMSDLRIISYIIIDIPWWCKLQLQKNEYLLFRDLKFR